MALIESVRQPAVQMGPRSRRKLTAGVIAVVLIASFVVGVSKLTRSPSTPGTGSDARTTPNKNASLVYGLTAKQVERLTGKPAAISAGCWLYPLSPTGMVGAIALVPPGESVAQDGIDRFKVCFYNGVFTSAEVHHVRAVLFQSSRWTAWAPHVFYGRTDPDRVGG